MSGVLLLGILSIVAVTDLIAALWFRSKADRAETVIGAAPAPDATGPDGYRRLARTMFFSALFMVAVALLLSFGIVPVDGITPIKF